MSEDIFVPLMWEKLRRLVKAFVRRLHHPVVFVLVGCTVLLVIADQLIPRRLGNVAISIADQVLDADFFVGDTYIAPPIGWTMATYSRLYRYAATRQIASAQVVVGDHRLKKYFRFSSEPNGLFWLYGAYAQGDISYAFVIREILRQSDFAANLEDLERYLREPIGDQADKASALNELIERRLNHGALAFAVNSLGDHQANDWFRVVVPKLSAAELQEMRRRALKWFNFSVAKPSIPNIECRKFATVYEAVVNGDLAHIRACADVTHKSPMTYGQWQKFLSCAKIKEAEIPALKAVDVCIDRAGL